MLNSETKQSTRTRLRRIAGQLEAIERMVEADRLAVDILHQLAAVRAALGKVATVVLRSYVEASLGAATAPSRDERERKQTLDELIAVFERYGQIKER